MTRKGYNYKHGFSNTLELKNQEFLLRQTIAAIGLNQEPLSQDYLNRLHLNFLTGLTELLTKRMKT